MHLRASTIYKFLRFSLTTHILRFVLSKQIYCSYVKITFICCLYFVVRTKNFALLLVMLL